MMSYHIINMEHFFFLLLMKGHLSLTYGAIRIHKKLGNTVLWYCCVMLLYT